MNKSELVAAIAKDTGVTKKDIEAVLKSLTTAIHTELNAGGKVQIPRYPREQQEQFVIREQVRAWSLRLARLLSLRLPRHSRMLLTRSN